MAYKCSSKMGGSLEIQESPENEKQNTINDFNYMDHH